MLVKAPLLKMQTPVIRINLANSSWIRTLSKDGIRERGKTAVLPLSLLCFYLQIYRQLKK